MLFEGGERHSGDQRVSVDMPQIYSCAGSMRKSGTLVWREVAGKLQEDIRNEIFSPDDRLPSEPLLAARYGVNRHTLRHAVGYLAEQGVLEVKHGKGTFLKGTDLDYPLTSRTRFTENIARQNQRAEGQLIRCERLRYAEASAMLGIKEDSELILLEVLHSADGEPLTLAEHYFPLPRFDGIYEQFIKTSSITASLKAMGVEDYVRGAMRLYSRLPTNREAKKLRQSRSQPIVSVSYINLDLTGTPLEYGISRFNAERVQFVFDPGS